MLIVIHYQNPLVKAIGSKINIVLVYSNRHRIGLKFKGSNTNIQIKFGSNPNFQLNLKGSQRIFNEKL